MTVRVTAISDVHGAANLIPAAAASCDVLLVLGDLINVLDYRTMDGILVDVFGREPVAEAARLRAEGRPEEARAVIRSSVDPSSAADVGVRFVELARQEYERVFAAIPPGSMVTFGNADVPDLLLGVKPEAVRFFDAETVQIGAWTFGFAGGGVRMPWSLGTPGEIAEDEFDAKLDRLGRVDVVCTHMPPRLPDYTYDVVGRKFEPGSAGLIAHVRRHEPRFALFGHVHNPLMGRGMIGSTEMINVGHFQAHGRGFAFDVPD
jgi:Icc-related predicted phosphoesterase